MEETKMADGDKTPEKKNDADEVLGEGGMRALRAERRENSTLREQLAELKKEKEEADAAKLSKEEQLTKKVADLQAELKTVKASQEADNIRRSIAAETGIPEHLLTGTDEASMKASAEALKAYVETAGGPRAPQPNEHLGGGSDGNSDSEDALTILGF